MALPSYPQPPPDESPATPTRDLLPIHPPPPHLLRSPPPLPSPPRSPAIAAPYVLTTHLVPAAYLRTTQHVPVPNVELPTTSSKSERRAHMEDVGKELRALRKSAEPAGVPAVLWNCLNRYARKDRSDKGLTLFFAHANGFPKEIWEPLLRHLLSSPAGSMIDEVWAWESVQHGDAYRINDSSLSGIFDWTDNTRDMLNFFLHYLPTLPCASDPPPTHLPRLPSSETEHRAAHGFAHRTLVAVGHSYGGCTSTLAALTYPALFSSLILVDPVIVKPTEEPSVRALGEIGKLVMGALMRKEEWPSREAVLTAFSQSPFFSAWDPDVLRVYVECGTYEYGSTPAVRLKMPGIQEAIVFSETHTEHEVYARLPHLDPRIAIRWVVPGREGAGEFGPPGSTQQRVWVRPQNSSNVRVPGAGHLIPQEAPKILADDIGAFLERQFGAREAYFMAKL